MQQKVLRPQSAMVRSVPELPKLPTEAVDSGIQTDQAVLSSTWKGLFRPQSAATERRYSLSRSFQPSSLVKPGPKTTRITLNPGKRYEMQMFSTQSQQFLRQRFRPQARINAYLMYLSASVVPESADERLEVSPQPYSKADLNAIRKAPSVEKMLKAAKRGEKEKRDRTVRKTKIDFLKVPILDGRADM